MLGIDQPDSSVANSSADESSYIFDVSVRDFEQRVMRASMEKPVIVDFWAPWCGPCKQLMPLLEKVIKAQGGAVVLAKVNLDENPELAQALRVQSVPTVFAFWGGQPVNAFQGVLPEGEISAFISQVMEAAGVSGAGTLNIPETLKAAEEALALDNIVVAQGLYGDILEQDEDNVEAYIGLIRSFINAGTPEHAREMLEHVPEAIAKTMKFKEVRDALLLASRDKVDDSALAPLEKAVSDHPKDHQAKIDLAEGLFDSGQKERALDVLLESIEQDRSWNEEAARKTLLQYFKVLGNADPLTVAARKKLSSLLFS